ncbi:MAG: DUF6680 family protein, partial [Acetobacteraceae bacterium]
MQLPLGLAVVFATFFGPIAAVLITRIIDTTRRRRERRLDVFRSLMGSRRAPLSPERVRALNMVEIEFNGVQSVERAYHDLMTHINLTPPLPGDWHQRQRTLLTKLLSKMATVLGYKLQQLDMLEGGYYPQGFADIESEQQAVRQQLVAVLSGQRPLLI